MRLLLKMSGQEAMSVVPTVKSANLLFDFIFLATISKLKQNSSFKTSN